jgi:hypothetical protein
MNILVVRKYADINTILLSFNIFTFYLLYVHIFYVQQVHVYIYIYIYTSEDGKLQPKHVAFNRISGMIY